MAAGGVAYRTGRVGAMGFGSGNLIRIASVGIGLTAEVSAFELTNRGLTSVGARSPRPQFISQGTGGDTPPLHPENPNLWRWFGPGGLAQGFLHSFIAFGTLRGAGSLARGENIFVQHLLQDTAMVAGHQATGIFGIAPRPAGSLAEQFLHAEATNLQIGAGMALAHGFAPGIYGLERGLDLSLRPRDVGAGRRARPILGNHGELPLQNRFEPALAGATKNPAPGLLMMASMETNPPDAVESESYRSEKTTAAFQEKIREEVERLHRNPCTTLHLLENYLGRLRILRLFASLQLGPGPSALYPMAGMDAIPSLFFPKVIGIDPWVDFPHVPSDPSYFREYGLVLSREDPSRDGEGFVKRLEEIYEAAAREPERHRALGQDAFNATLAEELRSGALAPRFVFLKGTSYLDLFYNFSKTLERNSPYDFQSAEEAALWLSDHYSAAGDHVVLWDHRPELSARFLESGRYGREEFSFLEGPAQARLIGTPLWADVRVEPILNPSAGLNLRLTDAMEVFKRLR